MLRQRAHRPFVGRGRELAALCEQLEAARQGEGGVVLVAGEPGIGKTRLVAELAERARAADWQVLVGAAYETAGMPPYLPFVEALRHYLLECPLDRLRETLGRGAAEVARLLPEVRDYLPELPESRSLGPEGDRYRLIESMASFLLAIARGAGSHRAGFERHATDVSGDADDRFQPPSESPYAGLLLVLEDLHWADEATLLLLEHLVRRLGEAPLLVLVSYRNTELDVARPLSRTLERLTRQSEWVTRLNLQPFTENEAAMLLRTLSGKEPSARLAALFLRETDGNPLFLEAVYQHLTEEGRLFDTDGAWRTDLRMIEADVPQSVRLAIGRRLERVSEPCRVVLSLAAIVGRVFEHSLVQQFAGIEEEALLDALEEAERALLLTSASEDALGRVAFAHELIRQTLLAEMTLPRRQRLHRRAAEAIERVYEADLMSHAAALAGHYLAAGGAGDPAKAAAYARQAGAAAEAVFAYEQALAHYESALRILELQPHPDAAERAELLLAIGLTQDKTAIWRGEDMLLQAADAARAAGRTELAVRAVLGTASSNAPDDPRLVPIIQELLGVVTGESATRARLLGLLAAQSSAGTYVQRCAWADEATAMARRAGDARALGLVLNAQWMGLQRGAAPTPAMYEQFYLLAREQAELGDAIGDLNLAIVAHCQTLQLAMRLGRITPAEMDRLIELHCQYAASMRQAGQIFHGITLRAMKALLDGRLTDVDP